MPTERHEPRAARRVGYARTGGEALLTIVPATLRALLELQAHCHCGLGTLYATTGQREQAHTALSTAIALYHAMDMTFWLPQTAAALRQLEGQ